MKLKYKIIGCVLIFMLCFTTYIKVLGASDIPIDVEKNGYCKIVYGENWRNIKETNECITYENEEQLKESFLDYEFRDVCPKNKIISSSFYSNCFHSSGGIS